MSYLLFVNSADMVYDQGSLKNHLNYLKNHSGSPDCWESFSGSLRKAFEEAENSGLEIAVVEEHSMEIMGVVND